MADKPNAMDSEIKQQHLVTDEKDHSNRHFICHKIIDPGCLVWGRLLSGGIRVKLRL